jgi:predicted dienelactone hydrolase
MRRKILALFLFLLPIYTLISSELSLGVQTFFYRDETRNRPVTIELWYPTEQTEPLDTPLDTVWLHPKEIRNASLSKKHPNYPLILMSHGHKGDRRERSWLADLLVKEGYIVASIDHYGDTRSTFDPFLSICFWDRPLDFSFVLDQLVQEPFIQNRWNAEKVGFIGYSLGGMTGLALAGARAENTKQVVLQTIKNYSTIDPTPVAQMDFSVSEKSYLEPRIKSMLLICPATFVYPPKNLREIKIPIGLIATIGDEVLPHQHHAYKVIQHAIPTKLKVMRREISHYSFLNRISKAGEKFFQKQTQTDLSFSNRDVIHKEAGRFAIRFFKDTLKRK